MTQLDIAFNAFKSEPSPVNAWALQVAMVQHQQEFDKKPIEGATSIGTKPKNTNTTKFKTSRGKLYNQKLTEILDIFIGLGCTVKKGMSRDDIESWVLIDKDGNKATLYLSTDDFTMGGTKELCGVFEGYEDKSDFVGFLSDNGVDLGELEE